MARPRKNDITTILMPQILEFVKGLTQRIDVLVRQNAIEAFGFSISSPAPVREPQGGSLSEVPANGAPKDSNGHKAKAKTCYFPGCKNTASPRHGMFCTAEHKDLPKKEKEKIRAARTES